MAGGLASIVSPDTLLRVRSIESDVVGNVVRACIIQRRTIDLREEMRSLNRTRRRGGPLRRCRGNLDPV